MHSLESNKYGGGELSDRLAGSCGGGGGVQTRKERIRAPPHLFPSYTHYTVMDYKGNKFIPILVPLGISWYNESLGDLGLIKKGSGRYSLRF